MRFECVKSSFLCLLLLRIYDIPTLQLNDEDWLEARRATEANTSNSSNNIVKTGKASAKKGERKVNISLFFRFTQSSTRYVFLLTAAGNRRTKRPDAAEAAAAAERARSLYFLKSTEANGDDSDGSSDSDTEGQHILSDGPADRGVEQGTWWHSFSR
jgi:hypothetical protein